MIEHLSGEVTKVRLIRKQRNDLSYSIYFFQTRLYKIAN